MVIVNAGDTVALPPPSPNAGTTAAVLLLLNISTAPPTGAAPLSVTVFCVVGFPRRPPSRFVHRHRAAQAAIATLLAKNPALLAKVSQ